MCKSVILKELESSENKEIIINYNDFIDGIHSKDKISANLCFKDLGEYISVKGKILGQALLECDLCLKEFEYKIDIDLDELFAKKVHFTEYKQEQEIKDEAFIIDLNDAEEINIEELLYQSIILDFPNKKVCDINCNGGDIFIRDNNITKESDPRMSIFKDIIIK